jgi:hypothetical protein
MRLRNFRLARRQVKLSSSPEVSNCLVLAVLNPQREGKTDKAAGKIRNAIGGLKDTLRGK